MPIVRLKDNHRMQISLRYPSPKEQRRGGHFAAQYNAIVNGLLLGFFVSVALFLNALRNR